MKFLLEHTLRDYVALGNDTTRKLLGAETPLVAAIEEYYRFFQSELWTADDMKMSPHQAFLSMHSFMTWTAAVRIALSGHAAATFPLFRTALEAACYAYLMKDNDDLEKTWSDRHASAEALKKSRRAFTSAVKEAAVRIDAGAPSPRYEKWIMDAYDGAIDHGAHPNPKSIYRHINPPKDAGDRVIVHLTGIYDAEETETLRTLVACLDFGLVIACVLAHGLKEVPDDLNANLERLNQLKEKLSGELLQIPPPED
ncbi:hypothetical protein NKI32_31290 [Mesorhizobium sp. M0761]